MQITENPVILRALEPFQMLFDAFHEDGFKLYAVGGCVRDWILGASPKDIDFTTDALPEQIKNILTKLGLKVIPVGELFGTIATLIGHKQYEITTFRVKESYTRGSRHPIVCYGKELEKDLERRDLTINAMAADNLGNIIDPFDGLGDIQNRQLRVPRSSYEQTLSIFGDDPLRMLRLARFKARLGFDVDPEATRAASDMAGAILTVSHERWFSEIDGLLRATLFEQGIEWLEKTGIWQLIFPEFSALKSVYLAPNALSDEICLPCENSLWELTLLRIKNAPIEGDFKWVALLSLCGYHVSVHSGWANQTTQMIAGDILGRLKFSSERATHILQMLSLLPSGLPKYRVAREFAIQMGTSLKDWAVFQNICIRTLAQERRNDEVSRLKVWQNELMPYMDDPNAADIQLPKTLSQQLMQILGVRGKTLGLCLAQCRDAVLDEFLSENDPCERFVDWVKAHFSE